ncbi:hypothetical protein [Frankia sp. R43]|uniref:hypothetical protein n=1 Tax=Frankia sp. R43 TaxID=269536 RepID=UPI001379E268|nr:hypothetical protein [Frankia sp. R43]
MIVIHQPTGKSILDSQLTSHALIAVVVDDGLRCWLGAPKLAIKVVICENEFAHGTDD